MADHKDHKDSSSHKANENLSDKSKEAENRIKQELDDNFNNLESVYYYGYLLGQLQYEGSGIWSRFNIMIGLNVSLFGLMAFLYSTSLENKDVLILIICIGGLLFSIWSLAVLKRLWLYHYHWKDYVHSQEKLLPISWAKPFREIPANLKRRKRNSFKVWFKSYTQPFFIILALIWISLITVNVLTMIKKSKTYAKSDINNKLVSSVPTILKDSNVNKIKMTDNLQNKTQKNGK